MDAGGRVRWARLDNLLAEGRKSQGFDPAQLWLLADWLVTEAAPRVRKTLADEVARLLDAAVAGAHRRDSPFIFVHILRFKNLGFNSFP